MSETDPSEKVLRKVGRNVVSFQKFEGLIKALVAAPNLSGSLEEIQKQRAKHLLSLQKKSLGVVVNDFFETIYANKLSGESSNLTDAFELKFTISGGDREKLKTAVETLVNERNDLIHHRLISFDPSSSSDCEELIVYLDEQNERLIPVYDQVAGFVTSMRQARMELAQYLDSQLAGNNKDMPDTP